MIRARKHLVISSLLFLIGILLVFFSIADITGASIGMISPLSSLGNIIIGLGAIGISFIIFIFGESDLEKKIKSFRRHMEKEEQRKISYEEARSAYEEAEKRYWKAVGKGIIKKGDMKRPLQYIIDPSEHNEPEDKKEKNNSIVQQFTSSYMHDSTARKLAEDALENQRVKKDIENMFERYKKGHRKPGGMPPDYIEGTDGVNEFRSESGARIYWKGDISHIEIVGLGNKDNFKRVINYLRKKYPRK